MKTARTYSNSAVGEDSISISGASNSSSINYVSDNNDEDVNEDEKEDQKRSDRAYVSRKRPTALDSITSTTRSNSTDTGTAAAVFGVTLATAASAPVTWKSWDDGKLSKTPVDGNDEEDVHQLDTQTGSQRKMWDE